MGAGLVIVTGNYPPRLLVAILSLVFSAGIAKDWLFDLIIKVSRPETLDQGVIQREVLTLGNRFVSRLGSAKENTNAMD